MSSYREMLISVLKKNSSLFGQLINFYTIYLQERRKSTSPLCVRENKGIVLYLYKENKSIKLQTLAWCMLLVNMLLK